MFICQQTTNTIKGKHLYHVQFFRFNIFFVCFICLFLFKKNNYIRSYDSFHTERLECINTMDVQVGTKFDICPIWDLIWPNLVPNLTSLIKTTNSLYKKKDYLMWNQQSWRNTCFFLMFAAWLKIESPIFTNNKNGVYNKRGKFNTLND